MHARCCFRAKAGLKRGKCTGKASQSDRREVGLLVQPITACLIENSGGINAIHPPGMLGVGSAAMGV